MIHIKINLLFGGLILFSYLIAQGNSDINACVNCNSFTCNGSGNKTGFRATVTDDQNKITKVDANSNSNDLSCVPDKYEIKGTFKSTVCFYSPELGCRPVRPSEKISQRTEDSSCKRCRKYCKCKGSSLYVWHIGMETMCLSLILVSNLVAYNVKL